MTSNQLAPDLARMSPSRFVQEDIVALQNETLKLRQEVIDWRLQATTPATPPADAALGDADIPPHYTNSEAAAFECGYQKALRARAVPDVEKYSADITAARDFRIIAAPDLTDYVLQWGITEGSIMTVTSIKISKEGLAHTLGVIDRVRESLPLAASKGEK